MLPSFCTPVLVCLRQVTASWPGSGCVWADAECPDAVVSKFPTPLGAALEKPNVIFLLGGRNLTVGKTVHLPLLGDFKVGVKMFGRCPTNDVICLLKLE